MPLVSMSRRTLLAGLAATLAAPALATPALAQVDVPVTPISPWADLELLDTEDRRFRVADTQKPFTLIRLWANWCSICMAELDAMPAVAASLAARDVETILISNPQDWARDRQVARDRNLGLRFARPSENNRRSVVQADLMAADGWFYVPRTVLYSHARQAAVWSHVGRLEWNAHTLEQITHS